jgi:type I restriction enzyme, R subunit
LKFIVGTGDEITESELPALEQLHKMGYDYLSQSDLNKTRRDYREVLLYDRLESAIRRINNLDDDDLVNEAISQISEENFPHILDSMDVNEQIHAKLVSLSHSGGLNPITITDHDEKGPYPRTIKLFDFDNVGTKDDKNDYLITNQFQLEGFKTPIFPDIVVFVNGIPLVTIECKSPYIPTPLEEAVERKNFKHYQTRGQGYERLFFYNHCLIATCGTLARHGTINSNLNHYARWFDPYPLSFEQIEEKFGRSREQEVLLYGILNKVHLLEMLQNFVTYQVESSKKIKKIAKHQQFRAVSKCIDKIKHSDSSKGGVIWHTQGSGKSLSMHWFVVQIMQKIGDLPIIIVTDRRQLDKQIHATFKKSGFVEPLRAKKSKDLEKFLNNPMGKTIMTTVQKFSEISNHTDEKVVILVDEAHRTQFGNDHRAMENAVPNGIFFAFTGTPIDKKDKNTYTVFGPMLDKYGFEESKADGATLQIKYFGKLPHLFVEGENNIEEVFERVFSDLDEDLKAKLKKQYVTKGKIAEAPFRIKQIALDIVKHFTKYIEPNGYKAMIVAPSREAAVIYHEELNKLKAPMSKIVMTSFLGETGKNGKNWDDYYLTTQQKNKVEDDFIDRKNPLKILIVVDMLLVGFDAPVAQVMYLDKGLREHNLLQAIARVNRPIDESKDSGWIIDYSGITKDLGRALENFEEEDVFGALDSVDSQIKIIELRHKQIMSYFDGIDKNDDDAIVAKFESIDVREDFNYDFKQFSKLMMAVMYSKETTEFAEDYKFLCQKRQLLINSYEGVKPSIRSYAPKIQQMIDENVRSKGISDLVKPIEITYDNFLSFVSKFKSPSAKTALIKNKAIQVIGELSENNPAYYEKLWERIKKIIQEDELRRKKNANFFDPENFNKYKEIYEDAINIEKERISLGFEHKFEFAIYELIKSKKIEELNLKSITKEIYKKILNETKTIGWKNKLSKEKKMTEITYDIFEENNFKKEDIMKIVIEIIKLAKNLL